MGEDGSLEPSVQEDEAVAEEITPATAQVKFDEYTEESVDPAVVEEVAAEEIPPPAAQFNFGEYTEESVDPTAVEEDAAEEIPATTAQFNFDEYTEESVEPTVTEGVMYDPKEEGMQFDTTITYPESSTTFERSLSYITPQLIRREEEEVVNRMDYLFGDDVDGGFKFEETGAGDAMIVTASNGETHYVDLDKYLIKLLNEDVKFLQTLLSTPYK